MTAPTLAPDSWATVARAQSGDADAFAELYERYRATVFRFVYHRVGNQPVAEDISGDVWVRVLRRLGGVEYQGRDVGAWIITIARNLVADHFKSSRYRLEVTTGDVLDVDRQAANDPAAEAVAALQHTVAGQLLAAAMAELTPKQRQVIELRFFQGLSTVETALVMGLDVGASKTLQHRATNALRRHLGDVIA